MRPIILLILLASCSYHTRCPYRDLPTPQWLVECQEEEHYINEYDDCPVEGCPWRIIMHKGAQAKLAAESSETLRRLQFGQSLSLQDLRILSAQGIPDEAIVYQLDRTETDLKLTPQQLNQLEMWGVRPSIIDHLKGN